MNWLLIGTLLGSIVTSSHDTREQCEGRAVILREKGVMAQCVQVNKGFTLGTMSGNVTHPSSSMCIDGNGLIVTCSSGK